MFSANLWTEPQDMLFSLRSFPGIWGQICFHSRNIAPGKLSNKVYQEKMKDTGYFSALQLLSSQFFSGWCYHGRSFIHSFVCWFIHSLFIIQLSIPKRAVLCVSGLNGIRTMTGAVLYQLNCEANGELVTLWVQFVQALISQLLKLCA